MHKLGEKPTWLALWQLSKLRSCCTTTAEETEHAINGGFLFGIHFQNRKDKWEMDLVKEGMILPTYAIDQFNCIYPLKVFFCKSWWCSAGLTFMGTFKLTSSYYFTAFYQVGISMMWLMGYRLPYATNQTTTKKTATVILCHLQHTEEERLKDKSPEDTHLDLYQILVCL